MNIFYRLLLLLPLTMTVLAGCAKPAPASSTSLLNSSAAEKSEAAKPVFGPQDQEIAQQIALQNLTFTLINATSYTLREFYASPSSSRNWEEDILGREVLPPGYSGNITIGDGRSTCVYDLLSVFSDGTTVTRWNVNLCALNDGTYTITGN
jgi:hypothetical protein